MTFQEIKLSLPPEWRVPGEPDTVERIEVLPSGRYAFYNTKYGFYAVGSTVEGALYAVWKAEIELGDRVFRSVTVPMLISTAVSFYLPAVAWDGELAGFVFSVTDSIR